MIRINCARNIQDHALLSGAIAFTAVAATRTLNASPLYYVAPLQAGLVTALMTLVARVTEQFFKDKGFLKDNESLRTFTAYAIGCVVGVTASVAMASAGLTVASVSYLGAAALAMIAYEFSKANLVASLS